MRIYVSATALATLLIVAAVGSAAAQRSRLGDDTTGAHFEVASIKRNANTSRGFAPGPPVLPNGDVRIVQTTVRVLIPFGFPDLTPPIEIVGLPSWADADRYDVIAKGKAGATPGEQQQMWRAL